MQRIDAKTQDLERTRRLTRGANAAVNVFESMLQLGLTGLKTAQAFGRLSQANLGISELACSFGILSAQGLELVVCILNLKSERIGTFALRIARLCEFV